MTRWKFKTDDIFKAVLSLFVLFTTSCAYVYRVDLGEIDDRREFDKTYFEVIVSELGVNTEEAVRLLGAFSGASEKEQKKTSDLIKLFQMGPITGNPVYNETYAENILLLIQQSGLMFKIWLIRQCKNLDELIS